MRRVSMFAALVGVSLGITAAIHAENKRGRAEFLNDDFIVDESDRWEDEEVLTIEYLTDRSVGSSGVSE